MKMKGNSTVKIAMKTHGSQNANKVPDSETQNEILTVKSNKTKYQKKFTNATKSFSHPNSISSEFSKPHFDCSQTLNRAQ